MKRLVSRALDRVIAGVSNTSRGLRLYRRIIELMMDRERTIIHRDHRLTFAEPNLIAKYRNDTFATKEPATLEWVDEIAEGATLWDVGANVGLYSIYAAKARNCEVYAFEPSVFNLELLARNVFLNRLHERITLVPLALNDRLGPNAFRMTSTRWGGALSTFGERFDQHGGRLDDIFEYRMLGLSMADAVTLLQIPQPQYIKIDVDGLEHFILRGGTAVLAGARSVLIEVDDNFIEQARETARILQGAGLVLRKKCDLGAPGQFNQWWARG